MISCCVCGTDFEPKNRNRPAKTCSRACTNRMVWAAGRPANCGPRPAPRPVRVCLHCGEEFVSRSHLGRASRALYCSRRCTGLAKTKGGFNYSDGRLRVTLRDGGRQLYSRCLMEAHLGRHLTTDEIVHHINGDKTDDRLENLMVVSRAEHPAFHGAEMRAGWERRRSILKAHGRA